MTPSKANLSPSEIAMIELMKLDTGYEQYHEDVDLSVPFEVRESYASAPEKFLPRLVAERAKLYCRKKMEIPVDEVQARWMRWTVILGMFTLGSFVFFSIVTALGVPAMFFSGEKREASVLAVSVLIGVMTIPCLIPAFSLLSLIFQRLAGRPQAAIADMILWVISVSRDAWASMRGHALPSDDDKPDRFSGLFRRNSYFASAGTIFLTNLYFVLMGIAIWGVLWLFLFSRNVNFVHESSLSTAEERASFLASVGGPVTSITGTPAPGEAAMQWAGGTFAFDAESFYDLKDGEKQAWTEAEIETYKNRTISGFRRDWSRFLLSSVWTWVFLPRVLIAIGALGCMAWFRRDFLPKHSDPANRRIVEHVQKRQSQVDEVTVPDQVPDNDPQGTISSDDSAVEPGPVTPHPYPQTTGIESVGSPTPRMPPETVATTPNNRSSDSNSPNESMNITQTRSSKAKRQSGNAVNQDANEPETRASAPAPARRNATARRTAIVGLGLTGASAESTTRLASRGKDVTDLGNLNGARTQLEFRSAWKSNEHANTDLVVLASLVSVPSVSQGDFLMDVVGTASERSADLGGPCKVRVVLTDGKAARIKEANDPDFFETRVSQWMGRVVDAGVDRENVHEFDVSQDAGAKSAWGAIMGSQESSLSNAIQCAGKASAAVSVIRETFDRVFKNTGDEFDHDWTAQLMEISEQLSVLYAEERKSLSRFLDTKKCSGSVVAAIKQAKLPTGIVPEDLQAIAKAMEMMKTVSPKWMGAGALGGLGLGAVVGVAAIATGGAALFPLAISILPYSVLGGAAAGQIAKTFGISQAPNGKGLAAPKTLPGTFPQAATETLRASILQVIVLEFQGNHETIITDQLREQTDRLQHHSPSNMREVDAMLYDFEQGMSKIGAAN